MPDFDGFENELAHLINRSCLDNELNTPDFIIAAFIRDSLEKLSNFIKERDRWWGFIPEIGNPHIAPTTPEIENPFIDCNTRDEVLSKVLKLGSQGQSFIYGESIIRWARLRLAEVV